MIDLAESCGLFLDPWQQLVLRRSLVEDPLSGRWRSADVAVVCSRQNGKNAILEARLLGGLFLLDEGLIIHTAHEMKAAAVTFERLERFIRSNPSLLRRVADFAHSKGGEGIELKPPRDAPPGTKGSELKFMARTGGSGRSFSADLLILDEAYNLPDHVMNAITPTLGARANPQVWYTSSAVNQIEHPHGLTLARIRRRAIAGGDERLAYFEWSADDEAYEQAKRDRQERTFAADPANWAAANPSLGINRRLTAKGGSPGLTHDFLATQLRRLGPRGFAAEHLSVGDWPAEPTNETDELVERELWAQLVNRMSKIAPVGDRPGQRLFAVAVNEAGSLASIGVAGLNAEGATHIEVVDERKGVAWVAERAAELVIRWGESVEPARLVIDPGSPAGQLIVPITNAVADALARLGRPGIEWKVTPVTAREYGQACLTFFTTATERPDPKAVEAGDTPPWSPGLAHLDDDRINYALEHATTRPLVGAWAWAKDTGPALVAVTLAFFGLSKYGQDQPTESWGFYS